KAGFARAIGEDMAEMAAAVRGMHYGSCHSVGLVDCLFDRSVHRNGEARPALATFDRHPRVKQRPAAACLREGGDPLYTHLGAGRRSPELRSRAGASPDTARAPASLAIVGQ